MLAMPFSSSLVDPSAAKRAAMREEFFAKLCLLGGWLGSTDTYKRSMWTAVPDIAIARAGYTLTMRKGLPEPGVDNQLIMAGHEAMLAQWFHRPLRRADILLAQRWFSEQAAVRAFPQQLWNTILRDQTEEEIYLPVDIWGFPGGQTFLPGVPCLFFDGMGGGGIRDDGPFRHGSGPGIVAVRLGGRGNGRAGKCPAGHSFSSRDRSGRHPRRFRRPRPTMCSLFQPDAGPGYHAEAHRLRGRSDAG